MYDTLSNACLESVRIDDDDLEVDELESKYEEGEAGQEGRMLVRFKRKDGSSAEFLPVLESFVDYWRQNYTSSKMEI